MCVLPWWISIRITVRLSLHSLSPFIVIQNEFKQNTPKTEIGSGASLWICAVDVSQASVQPLPVLHHLFLSPIPPNTQLQVTQLPGGF